MNEAHIPVLLTEAECQFILRFCDGRVGMDMSLKLALATVSGKAAKAVVRFTSGELSRLIDVLRLNANDEESTTHPKEWASNLAAYLSKRFDEIEIAV